MLARLERIGVRIDQLAQRGKIFVARRAHVDLRALRESIAQRGVIEAARGIVAQVDDAAAHPGTDPSPGVAEHDRGATGHVLEREPAQLAAEHDLGTREADRGARVGAALHQEPAALRAVGEAFADRSVDEPAGRIARLEDRHGSPERGLQRAVLRSAAQREPDSVGGVGGEAVPGHGALAVAGGDLGGDRARDPQSCELAGCIRRDETVTSAKRALLPRLFDRDRSGDDADLAPTRRSPGDRLKKLAQIHAIEAACLPEKVGPSDEISRGADAQLRRNVSEVFAQRCEEAGQVVDGALELARLEPLDASVGGLGDGFELRRDADVARVELAAAADRATDRHHREGPESHAVGA